MVRNSGDALKMEPTFYDDFYTNMNREQMKKSLTLDFNGKGSNKRPKLASSVLSSPDVNMMKLTSPELEKIILAGNANGDLTPTPTTSILFPKHVTQEQENYVQGFVEALNELHHSDSSQGGGLTSAAEVSRTSSTGASSVTTASAFLALDSQYPNSYPFGLSPTDGSSVVKDEPQTVPSSNFSSPPISPINMESQEHIKLERKRHRNRVAASKCRKKKLERIAQLETRVKILKGENSDLTAVVNRLREEVCLLKEQVLSHERSGCKIFPTTGSSAAGSHL